MSFFDPKLCVNKKVKKEHYSKEDVIVFAKKYSLNHRLSKKQLCEQLKALLQNKPQSPPKNKPQSPPKNKPQSPNVLLKKKVSFSNNNSKFYNGGEKQNSAHIRNTTRGPCKRQWILRECKFKVKNKSDNVLNWNNNNNGFNFSKLCKQYFPCGETQFARFDSPYKYMKYVKSFIPKSKASQVKSRQGYGKRIMPLLSALPIYVDNIPLYRGPNGQIFTTKRGKRTRYIQLRNGQTLTTASNKKIEIFENKNNIMKYRIIQ